ncbi:hypothetical protein Fluta_0629 [Fluviicola taffensis DSM 16823]|uniref:Uncharacterized protein n=1 Tax=Fluviicola taffensis (strain DSM 16823 / NCIMB 13979 / RW262) TaxID=755732 RepID=F2IH78_FLUTR|nr:hypothetical protein Fluta_0629 [Fluviicola taffensis DSM 16823]
MFFYIDEIHLVSNWLNLPLKFNGLKFIDKLVLSKGNVLRVLIFLIFVIKC